MKRRQLLHLAAGATALLTWPHVGRAQAQAPVAPTKPSRSARQRLEESLARIADPQGEGARACLTTYAKSARAAADAADARALAGQSLGPLDGAIVSLKDVFDVAGEPTRAASKALANAPPAATDAPIVRRLRAAGSVIVAKTNMTEFAFSVLGTNPHFGTPGNPADRSRIPGGSTSGGAVAVADGMCEIAIGTDTGGSCRVPAAFCGIVGFKPSKSRVPTEGTYPLSYTTDSIGSLARTVADCAAADSILAGEDFRPVALAPLSKVRIGIPGGRLLGNLDDTVAARYAAATGALRKAEVRLTDEPLALLDEMGAIFAKVGTFAAIEGYAVNRDVLARGGQDIDPFNRERFEATRNVSASDYITLLHERARLVRAMDARLEEVDALVLPTSPIVAPKMSEVATIEGFKAKSGSITRNNGWVNFFDLCAFSLPLPREGDLPVGLMVVARNGHDHRLFRIAAAIERLLSA